MIEFSLQKSLHTATGTMQLDVTAAIGNGAFVSLYGASGAGKTSILRMLAGFLKPDSGIIKVNNSIWFDASRNINRPPQQRKIGFVFQDYALFPNMNVRENIGFALDKNESQAIVDGLLAVTGLSNLAARKVQELSGGQQQRVALARAIAKKPSVLLLDEPLSAIDTVMRAQLQDTLKDIHRRYTLTTILVSHNVTEIIKLSDLVMHLEDGKFQQQTTPALFFQNGNTLTGSIISITASGEAIILVDNHLLTAPVSPHFTINDRVSINTSTLEIRKI